MEEIINQISKLGFVDFAKGLLPVLIVLLICLILIKGIMKVVSRAIKKSKIERSLHTFIENTIKAILYFLTILIVADMLEIPVTSLLATFSVVGLAASLAVQDTLANLASGATILATHPFKAGDFIEAANTSGTVKDINFTHTILTTPDNKIIHIPNRQVVDAVIVNYSEQSKRRVDVSFGLDYSVDDKKVKEIMKAAIDNHPKILKNEDIFVKATAYKESVIEYKAMVWVNSDDYWDVYYDLLNGIKEDFDRNNIKIPHNQLDVHLYHG